MTSYNVWLWFQRDRSLSGWESIAAVVRHAAGSGEMGDIFNYKHEEWRVNHSGRRLWLLKPTTSDTSPPVNPYYLPKQCCQLGTRQSNAWACRTPKTKQLAGAAGLSTGVRVLPSGGWTGVSSQSISDKSHFWSRYYPRQTWIRVSSGNNCGILTIDKNQNYLFSKSLPDHFCLLSHQHYLLSSGREHGPLNTNNHCSFFF